jgi:hypothetical protein
MHVPLQYRKISRAAIEKLKTAFLMNLDGSTSVPANEVEEAPEDTICCSDVIHAATYGHVKAAIAKSQSAE